MLYIRFKNGQGLGNQLWLYASSKSISEKLNTKLKIFDFEKFKGKGFLKLDNQIDLNLKYQDLDLEKYNIKIFNERVFFDMRINYILSGYDENVLKINSKTLLEGLFQSEKYFFNEINRVKRYIKLNESSINKNKVNSDICILNIRGGEYKKYKNLILPFDYWTNGMKNFKNKYGIYKFKVVTDDYRYAKTLFPELEIIHGDVEKCYATIYNCSNIILSNSSFGYFPCKTGKRKRVIAPFYWARYKNKFNVWASPANIYKDWLWQDENSNLISYEDSLKIASYTEDYYKREYTVLIDKVKVPFNYYSFIPKKIKIFLKKILRNLLPKYF
tara:strand:+ start:16383 stop:17369 length:987 start_codon:yes stop_codon:yes gene_type:complete